MRATKKEKGKIAEEREREGLNFTLKENFPIHRLDQRNFKQQLNPKGESARGTRRSQKLESPPFLRLFPFKPQRGESHQSFFD